MEDEQPDAPTRTTAARRPAALPATVAICAGFIIGTLYFAREVLIPIALAVLLTFLLAPLVLRLQRWGLSRIPAVILIVTLAFTAIGAVGWLVVGQVMNLSSALPQYKQNIIAKVQALRGSVGGGTNSLSGTIKEIEGAMRGASSQPAVATPAGEERTPPALVAQGPPAVSAEAPPGTTREKPLFFEPVDPDQSPLVPVLQSIGLITAPLATAAIVLIFTIFMLIGREDLRDRFLRLIGEDQLNVTTQAMDDAAQRVSRYLLMQSIVNGTYGLAVGMGLLVLGVPSALLWGLLAALLRFIPYVGPWIAAAFPIALSFAVSTTWTLPLLAIGLFVVLELVSNNVIEPWLYGSGTGVSTIAILVAAVFWTWLWGPIGLLLATPLTVCVVVMGRYVPQLTFLNTLLGDESVLPPASRYYQRLLAMDEVEATDVAKEYLKEHSLPELYDIVLLPALGLAEQDSHRGMLTAERQAFIRRTTRTLIEELGEEGSAAEASTPSAEPMLATRIMCLPARDEADEIAALMFARLLRSQGTSGQVLSARGLASEALEFIERERPEVICVSALPPFTVSHTRYLCKRLRQRFPQLKIIVGLWNARIGSKKVREQLPTGLANQVVGTLAQATEQVRQLLAPVASPMQAPPVPANEEQRLAELKGLDLLDTPPEEVFDRYTRRLAKIFDAPMALMSLIDEDRQWWKSHVGLPSVLAEARSTARDLSVCGHVVGNNELLVIDDLTQDERFANNPLIQQTGMRFYAGAPLRTDGGQPIGSLCLIDMKPRHLTETEKQLLQLIAEDVMTEVKLRDVSRKMTTLTEQVVAHAAVVKKDLDQARAVQRFLLPSDRQSCGSCSICYVYEPATQIGGDFVDVLSRSNGSIVIVVADAIGQGASAALLSVMIKSAFNRVGPTAAAPHEILAAIQQELQAIVEPGRFITAIAAIKPADGDFLLIASAGHYAPILLRDGDATVMEVESALPLLVDSSQVTGASAWVALKPDDRVIFFTDGAIEVMNEARELLGVKGLSKLIQEHAQLRDKELLQAIRAGVAEFVGLTATVRDDITLVVLENVSSCGAVSAANTRAGVLGGTKPVVT